MIPPETGSARLAPTRFATRVVGMTFVPGYPETIGFLEAALMHHEFDGAPAPKARIERDPRNEHDANAVRVSVELPVLGDVFLGHVPAPVAAGLAPRLDGGETWECEIAEVRTHEETPASPAVLIRLYRVDSP